MATTSDKAYVREDDYGVFRVGATRVSIDSVIAGFYRGESPETIQRSYPALSLEEVYGAIAYYLANRQSVDEYLRRQDALWERARQEAEASRAPVVDRLRALKRQREEAR